MSITYKILIYSITLSIPTLPTLLVPSTVLSIFNNFSSRAIELLNLSIFVSAPTRTCSRWLTEAVIVSFLFFLGEFGLGSFVSRPEGEEGSVEQVSKVDSPIFQGFQELEVLLISNPHSDQLALFSPLQVIRLDH